jgi:dihydroorotase|tara:strand:- start:158 stop:337 length:180 start_codon:yes stop_codon:yes gene_type:complete
VGHLTPGAPTDVCIFDPDATWLVDATSLQSRGSNTPFDQQLLNGSLITTLVAGKICHGE